MNIVINAFSARRGGGQTYLRNLLGHLDGIGNSRIYLLAPDLLEVPDDPRIQRLQVAWPTGNPFLRTMWEIFGLPVLLKRLKADILFCPGGVVITAAPSGCRTVTMFRNMIPFMPEVRRQYSWGLPRLRNFLLERLMLRSMTRADMVIFISDYAKEVIESRLGGPLAGSVTIPHGISDHFRVNPLEAPPRPAWLPDRDYLLYVSIFEPYKHHLEVIRGFHLLKTMRPTTEKLVLAGKHDLPSGAAVAMEINRLGLEDDVLLVGDVDYLELPALYHHAKVNIFASACENCPNILLEALGGGSALIVSSIPPMPEFGGDAVLYFNPDSPDELARVILSVIDRQEQLEDLGARASRRSTSYDWSRTARRTWDAIRLLGTCEH